MNKNEQKFYVVNVIDVNSVLPFAKFKKISNEAIKIEDERVKKELERFENVFRKNYKKNVVYVGKDENAGKHIEYFLIEGNVKITLILETPSVVIAEFMDKKLAEHYKDALKKTFEEIIPPNAVKNIFINEIRVEEGKIYHISIEKWEKTNKVWSRRILKWTTTIIILTLIMTGILSFINNILQAYVSEVIKQSGYFAQGFIGLVIGFLFQPLNNKVEPWLESLGKRKIS